MLKKALVIVLLFSLRADFGAANGQTTNRVAPPWVAQDQGFL